MTERAKRLGKYLEDCGWTVYEKRYVCPNEHFNYSGKFCSQCGSKLKVVKDEEANTQIESAIKYALEKKK